MCLNNAKKVRLIHILREHRTSIGCPIDVIKEVALEACEHKVFVEEGSRPSRENQRCIQPQMLEVLKSLT